jgi:hypothetical protein
LADDGTHQRQTADELAHDITVAFIVEEQARTAAADDAPPDPADNVAYRTGEPRR